MRRGDRVWAPASALRDPDGVIRPRGPWREGVIELVVPVLDGTDHVAHVRMGYDRSRQRVAVQHLRTVNPDAAAQQEAA